MNHLNILRKCEKLLRTGQKNNIYAQAADELKAFTDEYQTAINAAIINERKECAEIAKSMIGATRHEISDAILARGEKSS